ncbi:MAG TPA: ATP-binding protein [Alloacidobacterium sp.]|nr:ATP-binding protein [Alloacidobacterium sp.]
MHSESVLQVDTQLAVSFPGALPQVEESSNRSLTTDDLAVKFSRIRQEIPEGSQIKFRIVLEGRPQPLHPLIREHAYQIGREALLNAFRHAEASQIELCLETTPTGLRIVVRDNGKGISAELLHVGCNGLSWIKKLAEGIGAKLKLLSRATAGTEVLLYIPGQIAFAPPTGLGRIFDAA